jgi:hypothetical protein
MLGAGSRFGPDVGDISHLNDEQRELSHHRLPADLFPDRGGITFLPVLPRTLISAGGLGLVITLFSTTRGSRPRSRLLAEPLIIDSHRSPSSTSGSTPLIRAVPSRRIVPASSTPGSISSRSATPQGRLPGRDLRPAHCSPRVLFEP